jgi:hypothetical protein
MLHPFHKVCELLSLLDNLFVATATPSRLDINVPLVGISVPLYRPRHFTTFGHGTVVKDPTGSRGMDQATPRGTRD